MEVIFLIKTGRCDSLITVYTYAHLYLWTRMKVKWAIFGQVAIYLMGMQQQRY